MLQDFAARGMAAQHRNRARRLATLDMLARGIADNLPRGLPGVMQAPIAESRASATTIASGTTYGFNSGTPASHFPRRYGLHGGALTHYTSTLITLVARHGGTGTDPTATPGSPAANIRFATFADKFEIIAQNHLGFRVLVNGQYAKTGMYGVGALNGDTASTRYWAFDFAGTEFAGSGLKLVEIEGGPEFRFGGVRVPIAHTVQPWPQALPIKLSLHGDSMIDTTSDTGTDHRTAQHGQMTDVLRALTGMPDIRATNLGGCGFIADASGTRSSFLEQAPVDFSGHKYDVCWDLGGRNDTLLYGSQAAYQAIVESWIDILLADNPDTIIVLTGPLTMTSAESYQSSASVAAVQNAKRLAAAAYPRNCAFIKTAGGAVTNDPWVFGTGKQGAPMGNGNADLMTPSRVAPHRLTKLRSGLQSRMTYRRKPEDSR